MLWVITFTVSCSILDKKSIKRPIAKGVTHPFLAHDHQSNPHIDVYPL